MFLVNEISNRNIKGSSLIEVMISLFVMAVGMLGVLSMQSRSIQLNQNASLYSQASFLANDMAESIKSSQGALADFPVDAGDTYLSLNCGQLKNGDTSNPCDDPMEMARWQVARWKQAVEESLPGGVGAVDELPCQNQASCDGIYQISVTFNLGFETDADDQAEMQTASVVLITGS